ncbi:hypothetical protein D3C87_1275390 [compost metagenome]
MADGGAGLDQAQTASPGGQPADLTATIRPLGVGAQRQGVGNPLANKAGRRDGRAVFQLPALFQHPRRDAEVEHPRVQQPGSAEQIKDGDLALAAVFLHQQPNRVGALTEGKVGQGIGTSLQPDAFDDDAVDLDHHQG